MNVGGSAREYTKTHTCQTEADKAGAISLCDGSFVFCDVAADMSTQVTVRRQITRSTICRIGPVIGTGLHVGSTLVVSPTSEPQHYKKKRPVRPAKINQGIRLV